MIAAIISALFLAGDPAPGASAPVTPPAAQKSPLQQARDNFDQAQQIYSQSCGDRAYGAYDDLCEQLSIQVRNYHVEVERLEREAARSATPAAHAPKP